MPSLRIALDERAERRVAFLFGEFGEELREVGRVLLLQQVEQVGRRAHPQQAPHRLEDEIDSALGGMGKGVAGVQSRGRSSGCGPEFRISLRVGARA